MFLKVLRRGFSASPAGSAATAPKRISFAQAL